MISSSTQDRRVNNLFYAAGDDLWNTIRTAVTLKEPVDTAALEEAAKRTAERYPYFSVKLARRGDQYLLEHNDAPFVIAKGSRPLRLNSAESNGHLVSLCAEGSRLFLDSTHFLMDGSAMFPFLQTLLYCYLHLVHPEAEFDVSSITLPESALTPEELDDNPYPDEPLPAESVMERRLPEEIFLLPGLPRGYESMAHWTSFQLRISQKSLMRFASSADGSPATFVSSVVYRAIDELHRENHLPIVCGMQHQFRGALGKPGSRLCHVNLVQIVYPELLRADNDFERLNTIGRGTMILYASDEQDLLTVNAHIENEKAIRPLPLPEKQAYMRRVLLDGIGKNTFEVSYTGRVNWAGLDRYISYVAPFLDLTLSGGVTVEIFSCGQDFNINLMQRNEDPAIAERVKALLAENRIDCQMERTEHYEMPGFEMP